MHVQINTDSATEGSVALAEQVEAAVRGSLNRFSEQITRVEVHLGNESGSVTNGENKRCLLEVRLAGRQPIAVSHQAATIEQALSGATDRMKRSLDSTLGRLNGH